MDTQDLRSLMRFNPESMAYHLTEDYCEDGSDYDDDGNLIPTPWGIGWEAYGKGTPRSALKPTEYQGWDDAAANEGWVKFHNGTPYKDVPEAERSAWLNALTEGKSEE